MTIKIKTYIACLALMTSFFTCAQDREYWIAADEILWDYAPSFPLNKMNNQDFSEDELVFLSRNDQRIGRLYHKSVFREYSKNFAKIKNNRAEFMGILGPIIRAEVGDRIIVHFKNNSRFASSIHPHGVLYKKDSEGSAYNDNTQGKDKKDGKVLPGKIHTYIWQVPERAGPAKADASSIIWPYHSHVNEPQEINTGLIGAIIITKKGWANADGSPKDVDKEFVTLFTVFDENNSKHLSRNMARLSNAALAEDDDFIESNLMHAMNGLLWGNNTGYSMKVGEKVRWHIVGMGTEVDIHTPHWHGATLLQEGHRVDTTEVFPATVKTLDLLADNPGTWMYHCHVDDHIKAGMMSVFTVTK